MRKLARMRRVRGAQGGCTDRRPARSQRCSRCSSSRSCCCRAIAASRISSQARPLRHGANSVHVSAWPAHRAAVGAAPTRVRRAGALARAEPRRRPRALLARSERRHAHGRVGAAQLRDRSAAPDGRAALEARQPRSARRRTIARRGRCRGAAAGRRASRCSGSAGGRVRVRVGGGLFGVRARLDAVAEAQRRQRSSRTRCGCRSEGLRLTLFSDPRVEVHRRRRDAARHGRPPSYG